MGCGPSTIPEDRRRPHDGDGGANSKLQVLLPGLDKLIRLSTQNLSEEPRSRKVSSSNRNIPQLQRPRREKDELIPDVAVFAKRDHWSEKVPSEHCRSVPDLARYLSHETKSDLEKARAFYRWMAINICYDVESFLAKTHVYPSDPESVLKYRTTVCDGYAQLFEALCKAASVPCYYVAGFSKGTTYDPDVPITEESFVNHAWNVVCVEGEWWPCDVTWGAGYMDRSNKFIWHYNELNFLCDPEIFILAHFPFMEDSHEYSTPFQLLKTPISLRDFNTNVKPDRNGMEWGLQLLTHTQGIIDVERDVTIKIQTRKVTMTNISCDFHTKRSKRDFEQNVLLYKKDGVFIAKVKPPGEGEYKLMLYGETEGMSKHQGLVSYIINCTKADDNPSPYPNHFGLWGGQPIAADCGFRDEIFETNVFISEDGDLHFSLPLKKSVDTIIKLEHTDKSNDLNDFVTEASHSSMMVIMARLPYSGYYKLHLYANDPNGGGNSYIPVAFFLIKCIKGKKSSTPYSKADAQQFLEQETSRPRTKKKPPRKVSAPTEPTDEEEEDKDSAPPSRSSQGVPVISVPQEDKTRRSSRYENEETGRKISRQRSPEPEYGADDQEELVVPKSRERRGSNTSVASKRSMTRAPSPAPSVGHARDNDIYNQNPYEHDDRVRKSSQQQDPNAEANRNNGPNYNTVRYDPYTRTHIPAPVLPKSPKAESEEEEEEENDDDETEEDEEADEEVSNLKKEDSTEEEDKEEDDDDEENDENDNDAKNKLPTDRRISQSRSPYGSRSASPAGYSQHQDHQHDRRPSYGRSPAGSRSGSPQPQDPRHYPTAVYDPYTGQLLDNPASNGHSRYDYDPYSGRSPIGSRERSPGDQGYQTSLHNPYQTSSYLSPAYTEGYQNQDQYSSNPYRSVVSPRTTYRPY